MTNKKIKNLDIFNKSPTFIKLNISRKVIKQNENIKIKIITFFINSYF